jgi:DNA-binding response OmpR family regulator
MPEVLIVDDDLDIVDALAELLTDEGYDVSVAHDGCEGLECLRARMVDLILLDIDMPRLTGTEMADQVFLMDVGREKIPIVLLSAKLDLARVAARIGTPYFLMKPYPFDELLRLVVRALLERKSPVAPALLVGSPP